MKRIVIWLASTITVVVLLFGYRTSTNDTTSASAISSIEIPYSSGNAAPSTAIAPNTATGSSTSPSPATGSSAVPSSTPSSGVAAATYLGSVAQTRWGPVQVQITVAGGQITAVDVVQYPQNNGKDQQINAYALPILVQDTITTQSAKIDMVSGATVTSDGYLQSLQSALDGAGL